MRRKRKRGRLDQAKVRKEEKEASFNTPFRSLLKDHKGFSETPEPVAPDLVAEEETIIIDDDKYLFQAAMRGVTPLKDHKHKVVGSSARKATANAQAPNNSTSSREYLSSLVSEPSAWDISFSDEYMEGAVSSLGPKIMKRLKRGDFSIQEYIDLHGLTKKEAEAAVSDFIIQCHQKDLRCVLIIHGRGLGSADFEPAIKRELPVWFRRGSLKRIVLAFVTARPCDGGAGASYVLLRKRHA
jgi:DNA-nicking Smr family endonuclease